MASGLLDAIRKNSPLEHTASHDLESIAYVLGYAVLRSFVILPDCPMVLKAYFNTTFGGMNITEIINARAGRQPLSWPSQHLEQRDFLKKHMSFALASLMRKLWRAIDNQYARQYDDSMEKTFESEVSMIQPGRRVVEVMTWLVSAGHIYSPSRLPQTMLKRHAVPTSTS